MVKINDESRGAYTDDHNNNDNDNNTNTNNNDKNNNNIKVKTTMIMLSLCDYSDAYILVKGTNSLKYSR